MNRPSALQATPQLLFTRTQVTSMDWRPGDTACAVTYETVRGADPQTVLVALTDLAAVFSDIERCLRVAHVLTKGLSNRGEMTVAYVGRWTSEVFTDNPGKFVYRDLTGLSAWKDGSQWLDDINVMEANFPGFTDLCHVLCIEQRVHGDDAFKILATLAISLPFITLKTNTGYFKEQLQLCGDMGIAPEAIASHLLAGLNTAATAGLALPDLSSSSGEVSVYAMAGVAAT